MISEKDVRKWVRGYINAWHSNDRDDIVALFTQDARYYTEPHATPWEGHEDIVAGWLDRQDAPGETSFEYRVLAVDGDLALVKGEATYKNPKKVYSNLWELRFGPEAKVREFIEWWMEQ